MDYFLTWLKNLKKKKELFLLYGIVTSYFVFGKKKKIYRTFFFTHQNFFACFDGTKKKLFVKFKEKIIIKKRRFWWETYRIIQAKKLNKNMRIWHWWNKTVNYHRVSKSFGKNFKRFLWPCSQLVQVLNGVVSYKLPF